MDRDVRDIGGESVLVSKPLDEPFSDLGIYAQDRAAAIADQMDMDVLVYRVIRGRAVADMRMGDESDVLEDLQGAIDRGQVHP